MPITYETTAEINENGRIVLNIDNLPFEKGTRFSVKLIPLISTDPEIFKLKMAELIKTCSRNDILRGMTKEQIVDDLRRQREAMHED